MNVQTLAFNSYLSLLLLLLLLLPIINSFYAMLSRVCSNVVTKCTFLGIDNQVRRKNSLSFSLSLSLSYLNQALPFYIC